MTPMRQQKGTTVNEILGKLEGQQKDTTEKLRSLLKKALPHAEETVKWGNITYLLHGKNVAWIIQYKDHVDFGFFRGANFPLSCLRARARA